MDDLRQHRFDKLNQLIETGAEPYAYGFKRTHLAQEILNTFTPEREGKETVAVCGRLMAIRRMGKASFCHLTDSSGKIQLYVKSDDIGDPVYQIFKLMDLGDFIGVKGPVLRTRTGEITIQVKELTLLSKTLRPLPVVKEKMEGDDKIIYDQFADKELRYRQRYVDLVVNPDIRETFALRSKIISNMRQYLEGRGYLEVETPVLQPLYGGAFARPFVTHHNTLDMELYLRIADELYLKRLIVGGFDGVYEIAKDFRNEGMDKDHNPEFTMMELYVAYEDYTFMMDLVEDMVRNLCKNALGTTQITYRDQQIDFELPWKRIPLFQAIQDVTGYNLFGKNQEEMKAVAKTLHLDVSEDDGTGKIIDEIFSRYVEPELFQPAFIIDYPLELSPLAKKHRSEKGLVERFEGFVGCMELCNAFSELNDPVDQRHRFEQQALLRSGGDEEAMVVDEDYLRAMEYGMPPTAGLGMGIDRLIMLLTNSPTIRDVILFPQMRPEKQST